MNKIFINLCVLTFCLRDVELVNSEYNYYKIAEGWLKLSPTPANWTNARLKCFKEGGVLASPENEKMWSAMKTVLVTSQTMVKEGIFTGIHATYSAKKDYYSVKGTPLSRMPVEWAKGEPNNVGNKENCLLMLPTGTHADVDCSLVYHYICYTKDKPKLTADKCGGNGYALDKRTMKCYKFYKVYTYWTNAFASCSSDGAHLAIMNSPTESQVLKELCDKNFAQDCNCDVALIGHVEWEEHGLWMTIHGDTMKQAGFDKWSGVEPNHDKAKCQNEGCGGVYWKDGFLDDVTCTKLRPYICEKEPIL